MVVSVVTEMGGILRSVFNHRLPDAPQTGKLESESLDLRGHETRKGEIRNGRQGRFWTGRALAQQGVENVIIDPSSLEVDRHCRGRFARP
jgi:hypothetical protein